MVVSSQGVVRAGLGVLVVRSVSWCLLVQQNQSSIEAISYLKGILKMKVVTVFLLFPILAFGGHSTQSGLDWLAGCWVSADKSSQEVWAIENDHSLIGFAVSIADSKVVFHEVLSIKLNDENKWTYTAHPSGQASATFILTDQGDTRAVFSNPDHDYPQEIRYERAGHQLLASISLLEGEKPRSFDKLACE